MIRVNTMFVMILFVITGCVSNKQSTDAIISVDVTANYPKKDIILQDFMNVEYIALETNDEFLCQGKVKAIGKEIILITNTSAGDILIFDRKGKGIRKINRQGRGSEEYLYILGITLDEDNGEMFVNDPYSNRIVVYDLFGKFKRSLPYNEGIKHDNVYNFDKEHLICDNMLFRVDRETPDISPFIVISKLDGSVVNDIQIPYQHKKTVSMRTQVNADMATYSVYRFFSIIPYRDSWILTEPSSDTVFRLSPDYSIIPFIVRNPSIQSMNLEVFLLPRMLTEHFYFLETIKKEKGFPKTNLVYDRKEKAIYEYTLYNGDYSNKKMVDMMQKNVSDGIVFWQEIGADELVESYKKGELKGKLKEITTGLEEDSNPVIMLVKNR